MFLRAYSFSRALLTPTSVFIVIVGDAPNDCSAALYVRFLDLCFTISSAADGLRLCGRLRTRGSKMADNLRTSFMDGPLQRSACNRGGGGGGGGVGHYNF